MLMTWSCIDQFVLTDFMCLQRDIEAIAQWIKNIHLHFNISKCKFMVLSRKRSNADHEFPALMLNDLPIECVSQFKYLGVHISSDLTWSLHVSKICAKGRRLVAMLYRRFSDADTSTCRQLYIFRQTSFGIRMPSMGSPSQEGH